MAARSSRSKRKEIVWRDDEAELLLSVIHNYSVKGNREYRFKSKYKDIHGLFIASLPSDGTDDNFPHKKEELTQAVVASKLKAIRIRFRQAVDSGRRSGHGRVVMIYYELCESIWGGSPATEQIDGGLETVELVTTDDSGRNVSCDTSSDTESNEGICATTKQRCEFLDNKFKNYKQDKLKRKLPVDAQLLNCTQEELQIKKQMLDHMDKIDQRYSENMERMSQSMEKLSQSIDGFSLMRQFMMYQQPPTMYHGQPVYNSFGSIPFRDRRAGSNSSTSAQLSGSFDS